MSWFKRAQHELQTADGMPVEVWDLSPESDESILSDWAAHFRNHYCLDSQIDRLRVKRTRADYLKDIKFPSTNGFGPGIRSGDFCEILAADYLEFVCGNWVPRFRWGSKMIQDESSKGCDVLAFKVVAAGAASLDDVLTVFECKASASKKLKEGRLQEAIADSAKDSIRLAESLNYLRMKFLDLNDDAAMLRVERFQNPVDDPYESNYGAFALYCADTFSDGEATSATTTNYVVKNKTQTHPYRDKLSLLVVRAPSAMDLINNLIQRAVDEA